MAQGADADAFSGSGVNNSVLDVADDLIMLGDQVTIESAAELRDGLLALIRGEDVRQALKVDATAVGRIDAAGLQVLAAFQQSLAARGGASAGRVHPPNWKRRQSWPACSRCSPWIEGLP